MLDFAGPDAECERTKCTVRRRVAVAADDCHARLCVPVFRSNDMHNSLAYIVDVEQRDSEFFAVFTQSVNLLSADGVSDR